MLACPKCGRSVPEGAIICPSCVIEASDRALRTFQLRPLQKIAEDAGYFVTRRTPRGHHIQMFGAERSYCGEDFAPVHKRGYASYVEVTVEKKYCERCYSEILTLLKEARRGARKEINA